MAAGYRFDAAFLQELRDTVARRVAEADNTEWVEHAVDVASAFQGALEGDATTNPQRPAADR
ncbi:hypothetical protein ABT264_19225 [Streptomyces virginiae]|uniref:hypothetical protein n=1 Tax=Streptomyces virginiae TaxID=1961 RepID=UPI00331C43F0